ncbi:YopX family protein [Clostridium tyrobutyricum]|uniref:YopX family protein n=1 Tax=Clostridium tyrobutyricum TaxID=1519 RepID=UPI00068CBF8B|nr:YopX family protein [Clostridium tyrobutyricum]
MNKLIEDATIKIVQRMKFRGLYEIDATKSWIYGFLHQRRSSNKMVFCIEEPGTDTEVIPESIGMYTGLKDKNGKEIFEGDLCKELDKDGKETGALLQILWSEYYQFRVKVIIGGTLVEGLSFPLWHWDKRKENAYRQLEVIGDIYKNSELLKTL